MKDIKTISSAIKYPLFCILLFFSSVTVYCQEQITWDPISAPTTSGATGIYSGGPVLVTNSGVGSPVTFQNYMGFTQLWTTGPWPGGIPPVQSVTFQFPENVVVTNYTVRDINFSSSWNDSFNISNINFSNHTLNNGNCPSCVTNSSVTVTSGNSATSVSWLCSNPVNSFTINFTNTILPTAYLYHSITVVRLPIINPICLNNIPPDLPPVIGNNITGTWSPGIIDTTISGTFAYTFTPDPGQALSCPVPIDVVILAANDSACCRDHLVLTSPPDDVDNLSLPVIGNRHKEAVDYIKATNKVGFGDNTFQNGVVYHAGEYVELNPGFEAIFRSQFSAYIEGCTAGFVYRPTLESISNSSIASIRKINSDNTNGIQVFPNPSDHLITIYNKGGTINKITITSFEGKIMAVKNSDSNQEQIDVSNFADGIYIIFVEAQNGKTLQSKFIKN